MNPFAGLLLLCLLLAIPSWGKTGRYRAMWRTDPSTTMVIGWEQFSGTGAKIYFQEADHAGKAWLMQSPERFTDARGMLNAFVRLRHLKPDTRYRFFIRDNEGSGRMLHFQTAPENASRPVTLVMGGDSRNNRHMRREMNRLAAKTQPLAILFTGDMTDWSTAHEWQEWFDDWQLTITVDDRIIPIIAARGNHEPSNHVLEELFDLPHPDNYYALGFGGDLIRIYTLNSMASVTGEQKEWLEEDLERQGHRFRWRLAQYHHPMRPHHSRKRENTMQMKAWAPIFHRYRMDMAHESDAHVFKLTWPVRPSIDDEGDEGFVRDDAHGTVYLGEGCWGAPLRRADDRKSWTRSTGSFHHFFFLTVTRDSLDVRVIRPEGSEKVKALASISYGDLPRGLHIWPIHKANRLILSHREKQSRQLVREEQAPGDAFPPSPLDPPSYKEQVSPATRPQQERTRLTRTFPADTP